MFIKCFFSPVRFIYLPWSLSVTYLCIFLPLLYLIWTVPTVQHAHNSYFFIQFSISAVRISYNASRSTSKRIIHIKLSAYITRLLIFFLLLPFPPQYQAFIQINWPQNHSSYVYLFAFSTQKFFGGAAATCYFGLNFAKVCVCEVLYCFNFYLI